MAKQAKKLASFRLPQEIIFSIQEMAEVMSVSQSDVVESAIALFEAAQSGRSVGPSPPTVSAPTAHQIAIADGTVQRPDPKAIPGVSQGMPPKKAIIVPRYKCEHCGRSPAVARVGEICERCQESQHQGGVRDCPICADYGTGAA